MSASALPDDPGRTGFRTTCLPHHGLRGGVTTTRRGLLWDFVRGFGIALTVAACGDTPSLNAQVTIALPTTTLALTPVYVAEHLGLFEQEGLIVRTRTITGVGAVNAVLAGSADFTVGSAATMLRGVAKGQRFLAIANLIDRPIIELVIRRDVAAKHSVSAEVPLAERGRALKGLTIAIQGIASISDTWVRYVAAVAGLSVDDDLRLVPLDPAAMVAAFRARKIDGYVASPPYSTQTTLSSDAVMVASGGSDVPHFIPFGYGLLYSRPETCSQRPDVCSRLTRAFAAATERIHESPDEVFDSVLRPRFAAIPPDLLRAAWEVWRTALPMDIRVTESQMRHAQEVSIRAGLVSAHDAVVDYTALFTDRFVR